jgi:hypothetical protein
MRKSYTRTAITTKWKVEILTDRGEIQSTYCDLWLPDESEPILTNGKAIVFPVATKTLGSVVNISVWTDDDTLVSEGGLEDINDKNTGEPPFLAKNNQLIIPKNAMQIKWELNA